MGRATKPVDHGLYDRASQLQYRTADPRFRTAVQLQLTALSPADSTLVIWYSTADSTVVEDAAASQLGQS